MSKLTREEKIELIMEATWGHVKETPETPETPKPENDIVLSGFGCNTPAVKQLVESTFKKLDVPVIIGLDEDEDEDNILVRYKTNMAVVPTGNPNGHSYTIGKTYVVKFRDVAADPSGESGNHLPPYGIRKDGENIRLATREEIEMFVDETEKHKKNVSIFE